MFYSIRFQTEFLLISFHHNPFIILYFLRLYDKINILVEGVENLEVKFLANVLSNLMEIISENCILHYFIIRDMEGQVIVVLAYGISLYLDFATLLMSKFYLSVC